MTSRSFEFDAASPANVRLVDPVLDDPMWADPGTWEAMDVASPEPLVVVGFSTTFQDHRDIVQRVIDALAAGRFEVW